MSICVQCDLSGIPGSAAAGKGKNGTAPSERSSFFDLLATNVDNTVLQSNGGKAGQKRAEESAAEVANSVVTGAMLPIPTTLPVPLASTELSAAKEPTAGTPQVATEGDSILAQATNLPAAATQLAAASSTRNLLADLKGSCSSDANETSKISGSVDATPGAGVEPNSGTSAALGKAQTDKSSIQLNPGEIVSAGLPSVRQPAGTSIHGLQRSTNAAETVSRSDRKTDSRELTSPQPNGYALPAAPSPDVNIVRPETEAPVVRILVNVAGKKAGKGFDGDIAATSIDFASAKKQDTSTNPAVTCTKASSPAVFDNKNTFSLPMDAGGGQSARSGQDGSPQDAEAKLKAEPVEVASIPVAKAGSAEPVSSATTTQPHTAADTTLSPAGMRVLSPVSEQVTSHGSTTAGQSAPTAAHVPEPPAEMLHSARLLDRMGESEMRIGMHSSYFGSVEVHTVIHENQVGLTISSEKGDLQSVVGPEIGTVATALRHYELQLAPVKFLESGVSAGSAFSSGSNGQEREFQPPRPAWNTSRFLMEPHGDVEEPVIVPRSISLSVRA